MAAEERPVLVVFWAYWHVRSQQLEKVARCLEERHPQSLRVVSINVDLDAEIPIAYGMRALPLCLLFRNGKEAGRSGNLDSETALEEWLWRYGVMCVTMPDGFCGAFQSGSAGAFHGDVAVKDRLCGTLRDRARRGQVQAGRAPRWDGVSGTITGAVAGSLRPDIVEAESGLPYSFLTALEFLCKDWDAGMVERVFGAIRPGVDLSQIAPMLMYRVFSDAAADWSNVLHDEQVDAWRLRWLRGMEHHLAGVEVSAKEWDAILVGLGMLRGAKDPFRAVEECVIDMLGILSPPPAHDDDLWSNAMSFHGIYLQYVLTGHELGWTVDDFAFEGIRAQWFMAREACEPGGCFTADALTRAQEEWLRQMGAEQRRYDVLLEEARRALPLISHRYLAVVEELIAQARPVSVS